MNSSVNEHEGTVWDDLSQGTLTPEDEAVLRLLAEEDEQVAVAYDAYRPLDADVRSRMADNLLAQLEQRPSSSDPSEVGGESRVVPLDSRRRVRLAPSLAAAVAVAAAFAVVVWRGDRPQPLPYAMDLQGGVQEMRGAAEVDALPRYDRESLLQLVLRPEVQVEGDVHVAFYLVQGERVETLDWPVERSESGALRVRGPVGELLPRVSGVWTVVAIVTREPLDEATRRSWLRQRDNPRVLRARIQL